MPGLTRSGRYLKAGRESAVRPVRVTILVNRGAGVSIVGPSPSKPMLVDIQQVVLARFQSKSGSLIKQRIFISKSTEYFFSQN